MPLTRSTKQRDADNLVGRDPAGSAMRDSECLLLLMALRADISGTPIADSHAALVEEVDGDRFLALVRANRVTAITHHALGKLGENAAWRQAMEKHARGWKRKAFFMLAELARVCRALGDAGIECIPFKGSTLATLAYPVSELREFGDLDLLVRPQDLDEARRLIELLGYRSPYENKRLFERHHIVYHHSVSGLTLELHWALAGPQYPPFRSGDMLWEGAGRIRFGATLVTTAAPEALYVYLCTHGFRHDWERLQWLHDLPRLATSSPNFDWQRVASVARRVRAYRLVAQATAFVDFIYPDTLTAAARSEFADAGNSVAQRDRLISRLFSTCKPKESLGDLFGLRLKGFDTLIDCSRYLSHRMKPSDRDEEFIRLPPVLWPLKILVRPLRIFHRYLFRALPKNVPGRPSAEKEI